MNEPKEQQQPIPVANPETAALLEHHLVKSNENAGKTHTLLEHHLMAGDKNAKIGHSLAENTLEVQGKILEELRRDKPAPEVQRVKLEGIDAVTIKGDKGDKGDTGDRGEKGDQGEKGEQGDASSVPGPKGDKGDQGPAGKDGANGLDGKDGNDGKDGRDADETIVIQRVIEQLPEPAPDLLVEKFRSLPQDKRISYKDLKDAPEFPKMAGTGYLREISDVNTTGLQNGHVLKWNTTTQKWEPGSGGHTIKDEGTSLSQRTSLNFIGAGVTATDNAGTNSTDVTIPGSSGVTSINKTGSTALTGAVTLTGGSNVTLTQTGQDISIASTGGGTPGGSNTQLQYNNSTAFGGITGFTSDGTNLIVGAGAIAPSSDSTTAVKFTKADKTTSVLTLDTTNKRFGVNTTPSIALHVKSPAPLSDLSGFQLDDSNGNTIATIGGFAGTVQGFNLNQADGNGNGPYFNMQLGAVTKASLGLFGGTAFFYTQGDYPFSIGAFSANGVAVQLGYSANNNVIMGSQAARATNATDGLFYIPTCAGTPTGVPTAYTGKVAMMYDTTNHKLYIYDGGWKGGTVPGAWS